MVIEFLGSMVFMVFVVSVGFGLGWWSRGSRNHTMMERSSDANRIQWLTLALADCEKRSEQQRLWLAQMEIEQTDKGGPAAQIGDLKLGRPFTHNGLSP